MHDNIKLILVVIIVPNKYFIIVSWYGCLIFLKKIYISPLSIIIFSQVIIYLLVQKLRILDGLFDCLVSHVYHVRLNYYTMALFAGV